MTETLVEMVERFYGECKACGAKGTVFHGLCGICEAVWNHEQQEIHRLTSGWEDSE